MAEEIDARGLACPAPVVKTRDALKKGAKEIIIMVDNPTARDNVSRFASSQGCQVEVEEEGGGFRITITRTQGAEELQVCEVIDETDERAVVVLSEDVMGRGERELGTILVKAFLNTLTESEKLPWRLVLFNRGVLLAEEGADTVPTLRRLEDLGVEILVCGTCLEYFGIKEKIGVGTVSNMYDILTTLVTATNTVSI